MAGKKTTIWDLGLKVDDAVAGLKKIKSEANSLANILKGGITVKIDSKQFANLTYAIRGLGRDMAGSSKAIASAVKEINAKLKTISPVAAQVSQQVGQSFAAGMAGGVGKGVTAIDASLTKLEASAEAHLRRVQARFNKLGEGTRQRLLEEFQTPGHNNFGMSVTNRDFFISKDKASDKEFIDPKRVEAIKQVIAAEEEAGKTKLAHLRRARQMEQELQRHADAAAKEQSRNRQRLIEQQIREYKLRDEAHAQALVYLRKEAIEVERKHDEANRLLKREAKTREDNHQRELNRINAEAAARAKMMAGVEAHMMRARARIAKLGQGTQDTLTRELEDKGIKISDPKTLLSEAGGKQFVDQRKLEMLKQAISLEEKASNNTLANLRKARQMELDIQKTADAAAKKQSLDRQRIIEQQIREYNLREKAHGDALIYLRKEAAEVERKHDQANRLLLKEMRDRERAHSQAMAMLRREAAAAKAEQKPVLRSEIGHMALSGLARRKSIDPASIGLTADPRQFVNAAGDFDQKQYKLIAEKLKDAEHHARRLAQRMRDVDREAKGVVRSTGGIGADLTRTITLMAKWLIFFRLIRDVTMVIERAIMGFVRAGVEYAQVSELQRLALAASLNEHMNVIAVQKDGTQQALTGAAGLNALTAESVKQWQELQRSSLKVVGGTQDLMDIYVSMLPMASRLGATTEDMKQMVEGTAVAASLLGIQFQDARTGIAMLLQGRSRVSNRLIASLGLTADDVKDQKTRFGVIQAALQSYVLIGDKAQQTFGAMKESFMEMIGVIGSNVTSPFMDLFKKFVGPDGMQGKLFDLTEGAMKPKKETELFFSIIRASMRDLASDMEEFGRSVAKDGRDNLLHYITTVRHAIGALKDFAIAIALGLKWLASFISSNLALIKALAWGAIIYALTQRVTQFGKAMVIGGGAADHLAQAVQKVALGIPGLNNLITKTGTTATIARTAVLTLGTAVGSLAIGIATGGIMLAVGGLIMHFMKLKDSADKARNSMTFVKQGNIVGGIAADTENMESDDPTIQSDAMRRHLGSGVSAAMSKLQAITIEDGGLDQFWDNITAKERALSQEIEDSRTRGVAISRERMAQIVEEREGYARTKEEAADLAAQLVQVEEFGSKMDETAARLEAQAKALRNAPARGFSPGGNLAKAAELEARATALRADRAQLPVARQVGEDFLRQKSIAEELTLTSKPRPEEPKDKSDAFISAADNDLKRQMEYFDSLAKVHEAFRDNNLMSHTEYIMAMNKIDDSRFLTTVATLDKMDKEIDDWEKEQLRKTDDPEEVKKRADELRRGVQDRRFSATLGQDTSITVRKANEQGRENKLEELKVSAQGDIDGMLAGIFGKSDDKVEQQIRNLIDKIKKDFKDLGNEAAAKPLTDALEASIPNAQKLRTAEKAMAAYGRQVEDIRSHQSALDAQFENGAISVDKYVEATNKNTQAEIAALEARRAAAEEALRISKEEGTDEGKIAELASEIQNLTQQITTLKDVGQKAVAVFNQLVAALSAVQEFGSVFSGFGEGLDKVLGTLTMAVQAGTKFGGMMGALNKSMSAFKTFAGQGGGAKSFFSQFSGGIGTKEGPDGTQMATSASAALGAISFGASAAISIAGMLFQKAVQKAKETITKNIEDISKALAKGSITIGEAEERLRREREAAIKRFSSSKSGRKALKDMLPEFDKEIQALQDKMKDIRKGFEDKLKDLRLGKGPFADFARMLFDLEKTTKEYLDTFTKGSQQYQEALRRVTEMFNLTLINAKRDFESQMLGFESEAISSAIAVFDLVKEQANLYQSLVDIGDRQREINEQIAEAHVEAAEEQADLAKKREDHAKRTLELEKEIAEVLREAAQSELEIRQRGVLEAQESIGARKAREISGIRFKAQDEIDKLRAEIAELKSEDFSKEQDKLNKKQRDRLDGLHKELANLQRQIAETRENIQLNGIRLNYARQIAGIEGEMFDISGGRLDLEERRGQLEVAQAQVKVDQWREVQELIDSIVETGEGVIFNAPPGFPQIRVSIGDIIINTTNTEAPSPGSGSPPGGGGHRPDRDGPPGKESPISVSSSPYDIGTTARRQGFRDIT